MLPDYDPRTFHIESDREGFFVADCFGDDQTPTRRLQNYRDADELLSQMVSDYLESEEESLES